MWDYIKESMSGMDGFASAMRQGFLVCVWGGVAGGIGLGVLDICLNKGANLLGVAAIITGILGTAFLGKVGQAKQELKAPLPTKEEPSGD